MYTLKRLLGYLFIVLLIISLYKDLTIGFPSPSTNESEPSHADQTLQQKDFEIVTISTEHGETVLSIVEQLNEGKIDQLNINQVLKDFMEINPNINPYELKPETDYFFPKYNN